MCIKCFFMTPTTTYAQHLRRFTYSNSDRKCVTDWGHDAWFKIEDKEGEREPMLSHPKDDPRWPTKCEKCSYEFQPDDEWQLFSQIIYRNVENGEQHTLRDAPAGAMWYADWMLEYRPERAGPDGHYLSVRTPGGDWALDSRASNCTKPDDKEHRCWCRHGEVPNIHVDKVGNTCEAGGGSIICGSYHGFLHNGELVSC